MTPPATTERDKTHRFPAEIISHGVWTLAQRQWDTCSTSGREIGFASLA
jgi:hypothetical protein